MQEPFSPVAVDLRDYAGFDDAAPVNRRVFTTDVLACDLTCLQPNQVIEARSLPGADSVYVVLGGRAWVVTDDAEVTLNPLQSVLVPAGVAHGLRNDSPDPLLLLVVVSPPDEAPPADSGPAVPATTAVEPPRQRLLDRLRRVLGG